MKRAIFSCLTIVIVIGLTGCIAKHGRRPWACMGGSCAQAPENCMSCGGDCASCEGGVPCDGEQCVGDPSDPGRGHVCRLHNRMQNSGADDGGDAGAAGPGMGTVAYPYYTTRGPRDFLAKNPPSIGP